MKTNPNDSVYNSEQAPQDGLTKREHFAAIAMQGILSADTGNEWLTAGKVAEKAIGYADALINELNKQQ